MKSITRFITQKLKLKVNEAKSAVARPQERKFSVQLHGCGIRGSGSYQQPIRHYFSTTRKGGRRRFGLGDMAY